MKPRSPAQKRADRNHYIKTKAVVKKITVYLTQPEFNEVNKSRGNISMNAYCRSLIIPQKG